MKSILLVFAVAPLFSLGQAKNKNSFSISGNLKGLAENAKVFVIDANNPSDTLSRSVAKDGKFQMNGAVSEPNLYELNWGGMGKKIPLFLGSDKVTVEGSANDPKGIKVTGSPSNDDFMDFQNIFSPYFIQLSAISQKANTPDGAKKRDSLLIGYKTVVDSIQVQVEKFLLAKRSSYVAPFVLVVMGQLSDDVLLQEKRLHALAPEVQNGYYGQVLSKQIAETKVGAVGTEAVDFVQNDTSGHAISLSSFKGKYVLIDFWASWCGPCRMENPNVVSTYKKFKDKNFTVLGVSLDKAKAPWIKAINDDGLVWTQVSDLKFWYNEVAVKYHIQSIPQNFLIDPSGKIIGRNLRGPELQAKLCEVLGCN